MYRPFSPYGTFPMCTIIAFLYFDYFIAQLNINHFFSELFMCMVIGFAAFIDRQENNYLS
jgi:hypothetical protein